MMDLAGLALAGVIVAGIMLAAMSAVYVAWRLRHLASYVLRLLGMVGLAGGLKLIAWGLLACLLLGTMLLCAITPRVATL
jgi:hypothetical protein